MTLKIVYGPPPADMEWIEADEREVEYEIREEEQPVTKKVLRSTMLRQKKL